MIMRLFLGEDPVAIAELAETRLVMAPLSRLVLKIEIVTQVDQLLKNFTKKIEFTT